jgi:hypothetical protein
MVLWGHVGEAEFVEFVGFVEIDRDGWRFVEIDGHRLSISTNLH